MLRHQNNTETGGATAAPRQDVLRKYLPLFLFVGFIAVIIKTAWLEEDAFITFRTIDNFVHGYGLRWNIAERVQTFTHPLWMFFLSAFFLITRELPYTTIVVSILTSTVAVGLLVFKIAVDRWAATLALLPLLLAQAFVHYSTSGLENPMTHLLLALFFLLFYRKPERFVELCLLFLIAGLAVLNRMDTLLFFVPALAVLLLHHGIRKVIPAAAIGFLPFVLWTLFSLFYYGMAVPNTAYAKLNTGVSRPELIQQGLSYLENSLRWDTATLITIAIAVTMVAIRKATHLMPAILGILLYLSYVVHIGGDYMTGRFLSGCLFMAAIVIARTPRLAGRTAYIIAGCIVVSGLSAPLLPLKPNTEARKHNGVMDPRGNRSAFLGLWTMEVQDGVLQARWAQKGAALVDESPGVYYRHSIGMFGYYAPRDLHILDPFALADPLLSRLPAAEADNWWVGHFTRVIPVGYKETLLTSENRLQDKELADYYKLIREVTRGPLFSGERLRSIAKLNFSPPPASLARYQGNSPREIPFRLVSELLLRSENHLLGRKGPHGLFVHTIPGEGLSLFIGAIEPGTDRVELLLAEGTAFQATLLHQGVRLQQKSLPPMPGDGFSGHEIAIPNELPSVGPFELRIVPVNGQESFLGMAAFRSGS